MSRKISIHWGPLRFWVTALTLAMAVGVVAERLVVLWERHSVWQSRLDGLTAPRRYDVGDTDILAYIDSLAGATARHRSATTASVVVAVGADADWIAAATEVVKALKSLTPGTEPPFVTILTPPTAVAPIESEMRLLGVDVTVIPLQNPATFARRTGIENFPHTLVIRGTNIAASYDGTWPSADELKAALAAKVSNRFAFRRGAGLRRLTPPVADSATTTQ